MEMDLTKNEYANKEELNEYIYGSAETVGLMMARSLDLDRKAEKSAKLLGHAMQYINFLRDINEDLELGRTYFPKTELDKVGLPGLDYKSVTENQSAFTEFVNNQFDYYSSVQKEAEKGYKYIPKNYLIPIKTASDMYNWTAERIKEKPMIIYSKKVKPSVTKICCRVCYNMLRC